MVAHPKIPRSESEVLRDLQQQQADLARAIGRGQPALRDPAGNVLVLDPKSGTPLLVAKDHNVALSMQDGVVTITDEDGQQPRSLVTGQMTTDQVNATQVTTDRIDAPTVVATNLYGTHRGQHGAPGEHYNSYGDSFGRHHGDVGSSNELYTHWGDCHGVHWGRVEPQVQGPTGPQGPAGPKGFVIDHPQFTEKWLIHACTESPFNGVEYWGHAILINGQAHVQLPSYFEDLTIRENRVVHLTAIVSSERQPRKTTWMTTPALFATYPTEGSFTIICDGPPEIEVSWLLHAVRSDLSPLLVEPDRDKVRISGSGPYRTYTHVDATHDLDASPRTTMDVIQTLWTALGVEQTRGDELSIMSTDLQDEMRQLQARVEVLEKQLKTVS